MPYDDSKPASPTQLMSSPTNSSVSNLEEPLKPGHVQAPVSAPAAAASQGGILALFTKPPLFFIGICMLSVQICNGGNAVITKLAVAVSGHSAVVFAIYREACATVVIGALVLFVFPPKKLIIPNREDWLWFFCVGLFSYGNVVGYTVATFYTTPANCSLLQPSIPLWTLLIAVLFGLEKLHWDKPSMLRVSGLLLAIGGAVCVMITKILDAESKSRSDVITGNIILVLQCCAMGSLFCSQKAIIKKYPPPVIVFWFYFIGSIFSVMTGLYLFPGKFRHVWELDDTQVGSLAYVVFCTTTYNYLMQTWCNKWAPASFISMFSCIQPFFSTGFSIAAKQNGTCDKCDEFDTDLYTALFFTGGVIIIMGMALNVYGQVVNDRMNKAKQEAEMKAIAAAKKVLDMEYNPKNLGMKE